MWKPLRFSSISQYLSSLAFTFYVSAVRSNYCNFRIDSDLSRMISLNVSASSTCSQVTPALTLDGTTPRALDLAVGKSPCFLPKHLARLESVGTMRDLRDGGGGFEGLLNKDGSPADHPSPWPFPWAGSSCWSSINNPEVPEPPLGVVSAAVFSGCVGGG